MEMVCCQLTFQFDRVIAIVVCRFLINNQCLSIGWRIFKALFRERYGFFTAKYACVIRCVCLFCIKNKLFFASFLSNIFFLRNKKNQYFKIRCYSNYIAFLVLRNRAQKVFNGKVLKISITMISMLWRKL